MSSFELTRWEATPALLALVALGAVFVWAGRSHQRWPGRRTVSALGGLAAVAVALESGVDARADELLSAHMVQHMLLGLVAAPLLVASAPVRLALGTLPRGPRRALARGLHSPVARGLIHPLSGLVLFVGTLAVIHVPAIYGAALDAPVLHGAEHAALLWSAIALWAPVIGVDPLPHRAGVVMRASVIIGAMVAMNALGAFLVATDRVLYRAYVASSLELGRDPLADQVLAGGLMWVGGMAIVLPVLVIVAWQALIGEERRAQAREAYAAPVHRELSP